MTKGRILDASGQGSESASALGRVAAGIPAVRLRTHRVRVGQESTEKSERDKKC
jgi:hypothetical protein